MPDGRPEAVNARDVDERGAAYTGATPSARAFSLANPADLSKLRRLALLRPWVDAASPPMLGCDGVC